MAKIALLGTGKTGGKVFEVAGEHEVIGFNSSNPATVEALQNCDVVISFLTGETMSQYIDVLVEAGLPVATGATGMTWPDGLHERLEQAGVTWVTANNFALGMNIARAMIETLGKAIEVFDDATFNIHEVHHTKKLDAPSGTALSWQEWLGSEAEISSERTGDVVGDHKLTFNTEYEEISLQHVAKDRKIFAAGAVWTAERLLKGDLESGLLKLEYIMQQELGV